MKRIILAAAIAAVASMSVAAFASATPSPTSHFQMGTSTLVADTTLPGGGGTYHHSWAITTNPCTGQFSGTTDSTPGQSWADQGEVVFGNILGPIINIGGVQPANGNYAWTYIGMLNGLGFQHDSLGQFWTIKFTNTNVVPGVCA